MSERPQPFRPGGRVPNFPLPEASGTVRHVHVARTGKPIILAVSSGPTDPARQEMVTALPTALPPDPCAEQIDRWHRRDKLEVGEAGTYGDDIEQERKRTLDHPIEDEEARNRICDIYMRRVTPEITKVFRDATEGYYFDRHAIISYQVEREDFFDIHRDKFMPETRRRTNAVSLNLNDDFAGGELRFPEYGPHHYKMPAGAACVFSCSLLHEVLAVTKGQRFALTTFLWR